MNPALLLLQATRAPSLVAGAMPAIVLTALAAHQGHAVDLGNFGLTFLGLVAAQAGVNVVNDLFDDASGLDADPEFAKNPFPLGSRVIQAGALTRGGMWALAAACFGVGAACGLVLNAVHPGNTVLWIGLAAFALGFFYTAPPLRIAYHGLGEPVIFLLFGPMAGLGAYYVQTGRFDVAALVLSSVVGMLTMAILYLHHFPQHAADARHGKQTPIVRLGPAGAGRLVPWMLAVPYLLVATAVASGFAPTSALAFFATLPLAAKASRTALSAAADARRMAGAFQQVLGVDVFGGLLLAGAFLL